MNSAVVFVVMLAICAAALCVSGIYLLAGTGWAMIAGSVWLLGGAMVLRNGIINNG